MFVPQMSKMDFDQIKPFKFKTEERSFTIKLDDSANGKEMVPVNQKNGMDEDEDNYFPEKKNKNSLRKRKKDAVLNADEGVNLNQALRMNGINSKPLYNKTTQAQKKERNRQEEFFSFFEVDPGDLQLPPPLPIDDPSTSGQSKRLSGKSPSQLDMFQDSDLYNFGKSYLKSRFNSKNNKDKYLSSNDIPSNSTNRVQECDNAGFRSYSKQNRQQNDETDGYYNYRPFNTYCSQQKQQNKLVGDQFSHEKQFKSYNETDDCYYSNSSHDKTFQSAAHNEKQPPIELVYSGQQNSNPELAAIFTILRIATEKKLRAKKGKKKAKEISSNMDLISLVQTALLDSDSDSDNDSDRDPDSDDSHRKHKYRFKKSKSRSNKSKGKIKSSKKIKHYYSSDNESSDSDSSSNSDYRSRRSLRKLEKGKARKSRSYTSPSEFESSESESGKRRFRKKNREIEKEKKSKSLKKHSSKSRKYHDSESEEESSEEEKPRRQNKNKQERHNSHDMEDKFSKMNLNSASNHDIIIEEIESDDNKASSFKKQMLLTYGNDTSENEEFGKGEKKKKAKASPKVKSRPSHIASADEDFTDYEAKKLKKAKDKSKKSENRFEANSSSEDFTNQGDKTKKLKIRSKSKQNCMDSEDADFPDYEQKRAKASKLKSKSSKSKSKSRSKLSPLHSDSESFTEYDQKRSRDSKFKFKSKPNPLDSDGEGFSDYVAKKMRRPQLKSKAIDSGSESFTDYNEKFANSTSESKFKSKHDSKRFDGDDFSEYEAKESKKSKTKSKYKRKTHSSSDFTSDEDIKHKKSKGKSKTPAGSDSGSGSDSEGFSDYEKKNGIGNKKWKRKEHSASKTKSGS